ncbi:MAG: LysM domain-containing protein [Lachnospiraceae bacterium]|nr:LysM domain-containing protein [Lachnospiraceae bacterium]
MTKENRFLNFFSKMVLTFAVVAAMAGVFSIKSLAAGGYYLSRITASDLDGINSFDELFATFGNYVPGDLDDLNALSYPYSNDFYWVIVYFDANGEYEATYAPDEHDFLDYVSEPFPYEALVGWIKDDDCTYYYIANGPRLPRASADYWSGLKTGISLAAEAANGGTAQTVDYKGTGALPESVINMLLANPLVTLNYECVDAQGNVTNLVLNADILAFAEANVHWFGPKYIQRMMDLYSYSQYVTARLGASAVYTVQEGDTYESIAAKFGLPLEGFMGLNALNSANGPSVGQKVLVKFV